MAKTVDNWLYYGDNLEMLRHVRDASVDLVYLDPPFKSDANYNMLFKERDGSQAAAQIKAFGDTWRWDAGSAKAYDEVVEKGGPVADALRAFQALVGGSNMLAYLSMMAPRVVELHRTLKPTGSLFLHCDPTASHYLKLLLDAVFGPQNFKSEIVWKRTSAHSSAKRFGPVHDVILMYARSEKMKWVGGSQAYDETYVAQRFARGADRPWKDADLTGSGTRSGETGEAWRGFNPTDKGRHWAYTPAELNRLDAEGRIYWPKKRGGWPRFKKISTRLTGCRSKMCGRTSLP